ncbi:TIGR01458 family HAD-type hydrolase [Halothiobacillus sp. DCM-1]|uniref:TIGR01458 family HAD-type hydrolase n=1 Tax=Halothiobacillus sp. DCM-1 TaxID=3112558 RepID=UPI0032455A07
MFQPRIPAPAGVIFDIGGVLMQGRNALPGALEALARLSQRGIPFLLLTNTTRQSHARLLRELQDAGFELTPEQLLTPARVAADRLITQQQRALLVIHHALAEDFADCPSLDAGSRPDAVVIGDAAEGFTYAALNHAFRALMAGASLYSLSDSRFFQDADGLSLDAGPFVRLLEQAASTQAIACGKPGAAIFTRACQTLGLPPTAITLIGDDVHSDITGARTAGLGAVLVKTGKFRPQDLAVLPPGALVAEQVSDALTQLGLD